MATAAATAHAEYRQVDNAAGVLPGQCSLAAFFLESPQVRVFKKARSSQSAATALSLYGENTASSFLLSALVSQFIPELSQVESSGDGVECAPSLRCGTPESEVDLFVSMPPKAVRPITLHVTKRIRAVPNPILPYIDKD